jgi:hypothetical protein
MRRPIRLLKGLALALALTVWTPVGLSADMAESPCRELAAVDFANMKISLPQGEAQLRRGVGYISEDCPGSKDWKVTLAQDQILQPSPSATLRLLRVRCEHLTGSGSWEHVFIYACRQGRLRRVFQKSFLYEVKIHEKDNGQLLLISGEWRKNDPRCCPSRERFSLYRWDESTGSYIPVQSGSPPGK